MKWPQAGVVSEAAARVSPGPGAAFASDVNRGSSGRQAPVCLRSLEVGLPRTGLGHPILCAVTQQEYGRRWPVSGAWHQALVVGSFL